MEALILAGIFAVSGVLCHFVAKRLDRQPVLWGVMGCVFGPFALAGLFLFGRRLQRQDQARNRQ